MIGTTTNTNEMGYSMAIEFRIPDLGENIESADVGQILVKEGDVITAGTNVLELETEKAVFEVECPHAGKIVKVHVKPGDTVTVGVLAMTIEGVAAGGSAPTPSPPTPAAKTETPPAPSTPSRASTNSNGERPAQPKPAPAAPASASATATAVRPAPPPPVTSDRAHDEKLPPPAAPATRRLARELGVDLHDVPGSGPGGRIDQDDVRTYVKQRMSGGAPSTGGSGPIVPALPDFAEFGPSERVKMNKLGLTAVSNLTLAWQTIPHVTQHDLADITEVEEARRRMVGNPKYKGPKITMTVIAVKACVAALKEFPHFNASFDARTGEVVHKRYYNIGIAVDTDNGLLVPVVKNADQKSIKQIADEITELSEKARIRKLEMGNMKGGSFTISNLGGIGGTGFTPIVNWPEVAILGMSRSFEQPKLVDDQLENRLYLPLSLSYDHRVINGADAARFVRRLVELLSDPFNLLVET
jgi:pyruvate dehydrogenase E2 component (dihydrolipoamide acetyltransferase)